MRAPFIILMALAALCLSACKAESDDGPGDATASAPGDANSTDPGVVDTTPPQGTDTVTTPTTTSCEVRTPVVPTSSFFTDISQASGIQEGNYATTPPQGTRINDHSRLSVVDIDGDGWDDVVTHSLYPNAQSGVPFEHLVFRNERDGTFSDWSDTSGLRNLQSAFLLFGDIDNDGDQDVFSGLDVPLGANRHQILLNDGAGHFTPLTAAGPDLVFDTVAGNGVFADFNGDGNLDLYIGNGHTSYGAPDLYFEGNGDGTFANVSYKLNNPPAQPTNGTVTCDYDDDGDQDIFVSTYGVSVALGLNALWENEGGSFTNVAVERGFASLAGGNTWLGLADTEEPGKAPGTWMGSNGFGIDCKDVTGDGHMDILLTTISHPLSSDYSRKWSDPTQLLVNQGPEAGFTFVNEWVSRGGPFNEGDVDGALVDFDNDGRLDVSISRDKKYEKAYSEIDQKAWFGLIRQRDDGTLESLGPVSGVNATEAAVDASLTGCVSDTDCAVDGEACLRDKCRRPCTVNADCADEHQMCHAGNWATENNAWVYKPGGFCKLLLTMKNTQNHAWADFDHDGDLDLLAGGRDTGGGRPNFLFRNDIGHQNRWLAIRLSGDGTTVNRDAIGARVTLSGGDRRLTREVRSSRGMHVSADSRELHFGLGDLPCPLTLEVRWPDGTTASFTGDQVPQERRLRLTYPDTLEVLDVTGSAPLR